MKRLPILLFLIPFLAGCSAIFASPTPVEKTLLVEDFSNPETGWDRGSGVFGTTDYDNGMYRITAALANYYLWSTARKSFPADMIIEVTAIKRAGPDDNLLGIMCRYKDPGNFILLLISSDGMAGIAKEVNNTGPFPLKGAEFIKKDGINLGNGANRLRAECVGTSFRLYANDHLVASAEDAEISGGGDVGLVVNSRDVPGVDVVFDDLLVQRP